jgi:hypothetical protein
MAKNRTGLLWAVLAAAAIFLFSGGLPSFGETPVDTGKVVDKCKTKEPPRYQLLFFRNDGRMWVVLPPKTTLVEIFPTRGDDKGWVRAYNRKGQILANDLNFNGEIVITTAGQKPSLRRGQIVVTRHEGTSIGIYTPEDAAFIEIINSTSGFDGVVTVLDKKKRILVQEGGLDLKISSYN